MFLKDSINVLEPDRTYFDKESRPIKTRPSSLAGIKKFYLARLKAAQDAALQESFSTSDPSLKDKVTARANVIARLEERIMFLSPVDVPSNYVSSRAIKIRNAMMEHLTNNADAAYASVGIENREDVFGESAVFDGQPSPEDLLSVVPPVLDDSETANHSAELDVVPNHEDAAMIRDTVDRGFADGVVVDEVGTGANYVVENGTSTDESLPESEMANVEVEEDNFGNTDSIDVASIKEEVMRALGNVSLQNSAPARIEKYSDNGETVDFADGLLKMVYPYEPEESVSVEGKNVEYDDMVDDDHLTVEQVEKGMGPFIVSFGLFDYLKPYYSKMDSSKVDEDVTSDVALVDGGVVDEDSAHMENVREMPVVVPERDGSEYTQSIDPTNHLNEEVVVSESTESLSLPGGVQEDIAAMNALKDRLRLLKEKQDSLGADLTAAKSEADSTSQIAAQEAERTKDAKAKFSELYSKLQDLIAQGEKTNSDMQGQIEAYRRDAESNRQFTQACIASSEMYNSLLDDASTTVGVGIRR